MDMNKRYVLAFDVGTSSVKAVLIDKTGNILAQAEESYSFSYPYPGWVEQDPEDYWKAITKTSKSVISESVIDNNDLIGIVFTTQAMGIIPISKENKILYNNITWVDGRAEVEAEKFMNILGGKQLFKSIIGIEITGKDVIPKLNWLKKHHPDIFEKTEYILDVNGFLKYKATGKKVTEWSGACSYSFNLKKKDWDRSIFKIAGVDTKKLPPLVKSTDIVGGLSKEAAKEMGLPEGIDVYGGCDDTQSAAIGSGSVNEGEAHIYLGTSAWLGVSTKKSPKFKNGAVCLQSADPEQNLVVGITESAGANLEWFISKFYQHELKDPSIPNIYNFAYNEAKDVPPGSDYLIFTPWLLGERCPVSTTTTRGTIFNLSLEHTRGHFIRAFAEGIAYNLRWIKENYKKDFGFDIKKMRVIGGGSQNDDWMQIIADVTACEIETTNQAKMAGTIGAAMCAFVGSNTLQNFKSVNTIVKKEKTFLPNMGNNTIYNDLFNSYKSVYFSLNKAYKKSNSIRFK